MLTARAETKHEYEIKVGEFSTLQVLDNANVVWRCLPDSVGYIQFCGEERFADAFILTNNGKGTLKVQVSTEDVNDPALPTLYVYSSFLTEVKSSSDKTVSAEFVPPAAEVKATLIGNGRLDLGSLRCNRVSAKIATGNGVITLEGECQDASFAMIGTGQIRADELKANNVSCSIMGTGSIYTWPVDKLASKGFGSTTIYYRGTPKDIKKAGGGKLMPLESAGEAVRVAPGAPTRQQVATRRSAVAEEPVEVTEQSTATEEVVEEIPDEEVAAETTEEETQEEAEEAEEEPVTLPVRRN